MLRMELTNTSVVIGVKEMFCYLLIQYKYSQIVEKVTNIVCIEAAKEQKRVRYEWNYALLETSRLILLINKKELFVPKHIKIVR